jgi:hypothetical protein
VLSGIGAPQTQTNYDNLWAWTSGESPLNAPMRWNNPLNTTQPEPGATNANSAGVKRYPTIATGIAGTRDTLLNGYYPDLVQALRSGQPHTSWSTKVQANITKWGTGLGWVHSSAPAPKTGTSSSPGYGGAPTISDPFGGLSAAVGGFGAGLNKEITGGLEVMGGAVLILAGLGILVLMGLRGAAPAAQKVAQFTSPAGRAAAVVGGAVQRPQRGRTAPAAPQPLSPQAQASVAAARAGRGSKLTPEVKAELRSRGNAA